MLTDRAAFLEAIRANPFDALPRMVFADWLDEHGEGRKAAHYRAAAARLPATLEAVRLTRAWRRICYLNGRDPFYRREPAPGERRRFYFVVNRWPTHDLRTAHLATLAEARAAIGELLSHWFGAPPPACEREIQWIETFIQETYSP